LEARLARLPGKRELAALTILHGRGPRLEYGEAIELLREELCVTKRTARNIIKRLRRLSLVSITREGGVLVVEAESPCKAVELAVSGYLERRMRRCTLRGPR